MYVCVCIYLSTFPHYIMVTRILPYFFHLTLYLCKPMAVSFQCMTKSTTIKKKKNTISFLVNTL